MNISEENFVLEEEDEYENACLTRNALHDKDYAAAAGDRGGAAVTPQSQQVVLSSSSEDTVETTSLSSNFLFSSAKCVNPSLFSSSSTSSAAVSLCASPATSPAVIYSSSKFHTSLSKPASWQFSDSATSTASSSSSSCKASSFPFSSSPSFSSSLSSPSAGRTAFTATSYWAPSPTSSSTCCAVSSSSSSSPSSSSSLSRSPVAALVTSNISTAAASPVAATTSYWASQSSSSSSSDCSPLDAAISSPALSRPFYRGYEPLTFSAPSPPASLSFSPLPLSVQLKQQQQQHQQQQRQQQLRRQQQERQEQEERQQQEECQQQHIYYENASVWDFEEESVAQQESGTVTENKICKEQQFDREERHNRIGHRFHSSPGALLLPNAIVSAYITNLWAYADICPRGFSRQHMYLIARSFRCSEYSSRTAQAVLIRMQHPTCTAVLSTNGRLSVMGGLTQQQAIWQAYRIAYKLRYRTLWKFCPKKQYSRELPEIENSESDENSREKGGEENEQEKKKEKEKEREKRVHISSLMREEKEKGGHVQEQGEMERTSYGNSNRREADRPCSGTREHCRRYNSVSSGEKYRVGASSCGDNKNTGVTQPSEVRFSCQQQYRVEDQQQQQQQHRVEQEQQQQQQGKDEQQQQDEKEEEHQQHQYDVGEQPQQEGEVRGQKRGMQDVQEKDAREKRIFFSTGRTRFNAEKRRGEDEELRQSQLKLELRHKPALLQDYALQYVCDPSIQFLPQQVHVQQMVCCIQLRGSHKSHPDVNKIAKHSLLTGRVFQTKDGISIKIPLPPRRPGCQTPIRPSASSFSSSSSYSDSSSLLSSSSSSLSSSSHATNVTASPTASPAHHAAVTVGTAAVAGNAGVTEAAFAGTAVSGAAARALPFSYPHNLRRENTATAAATEGDSSSFSSSTSPRRLSFLEEDSDVASALFAGLEEHSPHHSSSSMRGVHYMGSADGRREKECFTDRKEEEESSTVYTGYGVDPSRNVQTTRQRNVRARSLASGYAHLYSNNNYSDDDDNIDGDNNNHRSNNEDDTIHNYPENSRLGRDSMNASNRDIFYNEGGLHTDLSSKKKETIYHKDSLVDEDMYRGQEKYITTPEQLAGGEAAGGTCVLYRSSGRGLILGCRTIEEIHYVIRFLTPALSDA